MNISPDCPNVEILSASKRISTGGLREFNKFT